jgi:hypothetical protein
MILMEVTVQAVEFRQLDVHERHVETHSGYLQGALFAVRELAVPARNAALIFFLVVDVEYKKL